MTTKQMQGRKQRAANQPLDQTTIPTKNSSNPGCCRARPYVAARLATFHFNHHVNGTRAACKKVSSAVPTAVCNQSAKTNQRQANPTRYHQTNLDELPTPFSYPIDDNQLILLL